MIGLVKAGLRQILLMMTLICCGIGIALMIETGLSYTIVVQGLHPTIELPWQAALLQLLRWISLGGLCYVGAQLLSDPLCE